MIVCLFVCLFACLLVSLCVASCRVVSCRVGVISVSCRCRVASRSVALCVRLFVRLSFCTFFPGGLVCLGRFFHPESPNHGRNIWKVPCQILEGTFIWVLGFLHVFFEKNTFVTPETCGK